VPGQNDDGNTLQGTTGPLQHSAKPRVWAARGGIARVPLTYNVEPADTPGRSSVPAASKVQSVYRFSPQLAIYHMANILTSTLRRGSLSSWAGNLKALCPTHGVTSLPPFPASESNIFNA
jgi:hypothetical protein